MTIDLDAPATRQGGRAAHPETLPTTLDVRRPPDRTAVARGVLGCTALLLTWLVLFALVLSGVQESRSQKVLYAELRQQLAEATAPVSGPIANGKPIATLTIEAIGVRDLVIVQGTTSGDLTAGPGHRPDTVLPGQVGQSVLFGRSLTFGGPFRRVPSLALGDQIVATTGQGRFTFMVTAVRRAGDLGSAPASGRSMLTLVTSEGRGWGDRWAPDSTVFVDATSKTGAPVGAVSAAASYEAPMKGQHGELIKLVLWLQLLAVTGLAMVWASQRWGRTQTWVVGGAALTGVLWLATDAAWLLLPNLL